MCIMHVCLLIRFFLGIVGKMLCSAQEIELLARLVCMQLFLGIVGEMRYALSRN